jgi:hypothetical protein
MSLRQAIVAMYFVMMSAVAAAEPCMPATAGARALTFDFSDEKTRAGMQDALGYGLSPLDSFPYEQIADAKDSCHLGSFMIGKIKSRLLAGMNPPRWAQHPRNAGMVFFLCLMPRPETALKAKGKAFSMKPGDEMYAAVVAEGRTRHIYAFFDGIPSDDVLLEFARGSLSGDFDPLFSVGD